MIVFLLNNRTDRLNGKGVVKQYSGPLFDFFNGFSCFLLSRLGENSILAPGGLFLCNGNQTS